MKNFDYTDYNYDIESVMEDKKDSIMSDLSSAIDDAFNYCDMADGIEDIIEQAYNDGYENGYDDAKEESETDKAEAYNKAVEDVMSIICNELKNVVYKSLGIPTEEDIFGNAEASIEDVIAEAERKSL